MSNNHAATRNRRLRRAVASKYLKEQWDLDYKSTTLAKLATLGGGPPMEYAGRFPLYPIDGLDGWASAKISPRVKNTAERTALLKEQGASIAA